MNCFEELLETNRKDTLKNDFVTVNVLPLQFIKIELSSIWQN